MEDNIFDSMRDMDKAMRESDKIIREMNKVKFKIVEANSQLRLEKAVNEFLADNIKLVDWKFNSYDGCYVFTCTYQNLPSLD